VAPKNPFQLNRARLLKNLIHGLKIGNCINIGKVYNAAATALSFPDSYPLRGRKSGYFPWKI